MVVTAGYNDGSSKVVTNYTYSPTGALTVDDTSVTVSYTDVGVTVSTTQGISVVEGTLLNDIAEGQIIKINESGVPIEFYVAKHNYESGLNGTGRTLVVRKECYDERAWNSKGTNAYAASSLDTWFNNGYKNLLDAEIAILISTTKFYYTPGNLNDTVSTLERSIFTLSVTELGVTSTYSNIEGSSLPIASTLRSVETAQWTRSPRLSSNGTPIYLNGRTVGINLGASSENWCRPAFTLPSTTLVDSNNNIITS